MLPNESLLQMLHFADYKTLVLVKLSERRFLRLVVKFTEELARRRSFQVHFITTYITYNDVTIVGAGKIIHYADNQPSLEAACRELDAAIGPHSVATLIFSENTWNMRGICGIFEAAPSLKYAENVFLNCPNESTIYNLSEALMLNFAGMKSLGLWFKYDVFREFSWTFLRQESARELRLIKVAVSPSDNICRSVEELVRQCVTLPHLRDGEPLELDFAANHFSRAFVLRVIEISA